MTLPVVMRVKEKGWGEMEENTIKEGRKRISVGVVRSNARRERK